MISAIGIVGAGTMGAGIAQICSAAGLHVTIVDINDAAVQRVVPQTSNYFDRMIKKGILSNTEKMEALSRIVGTSDYDALHAVDIVIEAATENFDLKCKILGQVSSIVEESTIIASNTSSLSITKLATAVPNPQRFIGMHFFNPVPVMSLVEIIRGLQTSDDTHEKVEMLTRQVEKRPIAVKNSPGFAVNRLLCPMINEAFCVLGEGLAQAVDIDDAMKLGCNHPIGPLALADMIGLDTLLAVMEVLYTEFGDPKYRPAMYLREMVAAGYLGRKTGQGVYSYK